MSHTLPVLLDSSAWIAYWNEEPRAVGVLDRYARRVEKVVVPTLVIYELHRHLLKTLPEPDAILFVKQLSRATLVPCDEKIALLAATLGRQHRLGTADSIILATASASGAELLTLDNDFRGISGCRVIG